MGRCQAEREDHPPRITYLGFNQDQTCVAVGTWSGFMVFSTDGLALLHQEACGAVFLVEMLFRTSLVALVGTGPSGSPMGLTMWNTKERCNICQLHFSARIHGVKMNHRRVVVLLKQKIHIFDLKSMRGLHVIDRMASPCADPSLGWLCAAHESGFLATPLALAGSASAGGGPGRGGGEQEGGQGTAWSAVHATGRSCPYDQRGVDAARSLDGFAPGGDCAEAQLGLVTIVDTHTLKPVGSVLAHRSPVQALCLNPTGQLLVTASTKGTVVRLFAVPSLDLLCAFRRGACACQIFGLNFSRDSSHVCASASSGTVHIFRNSEQMLSALPLQSEEATVGAAHREIISSQQTLSASPLAEPPLVRPRATDAPATVVTSGAGGGQACDEVSSEADELSDWNVVSERPERMLELELGCGFAPRAAVSAWPCPAGGGTLLQLGSAAMSRKHALQTLSAVSEYAAGNTARYAKSFLQLLPQPCRELVDAPRAFAWVHLQEDAATPRRPGAAPAERRSSHDGGVLLKMAAPLAEGLRVVMLSVAGASPPGAFAVGGHVGDYVACVCHYPRNAGPARRNEVLVVSALGSAQIYEWSASTGGECRLRHEYAFWNPARPA